MYIYAADTKGLDKGLQAEVLKKSEEQPILMCYCQTRSNFSFKDHFNGTKA